MTLGQRLAFLRTQAGEKQKDMAAALDMTQAALSSYEKDTRNMSLNVIRKCAEHFNMTVSEFIGETQPEDNVRASNKTENAPAQESASAEGDRIRQEIVQKIFDLFEQHNCSVGAAEQIMDDVKWKIWATVPVKGGFYEFFDK